MLLIKPERTALYADHPITRRRITDWRGAVEILQKRCEEAGIAMQQIDQTLIKNLVATKRLIVAHRATRIHFFDVEDLETAFDLDIIRYHTTRPTYSDEVKAEAIELVTIQHLSYAEVSRRLSSPEHLLSRSTVRKWINEAGQGSKP